MTIKFSELEHITGGSILRLFRDEAVHSIITDSRKADAGAGATFFAIKGKYHDGHKYIHELYRRGIRQFVLEYNIETTELKEANILLTTSTIDALQKIVAHYRVSIDVPVVGITGSNGKTIVKEWLFQLLSPDYKIAKNPGSYNSQLGVPLSVWQLQLHHQMGIFEAGISKPGEMERLANVLRPDIGIFTNIGSAHAEGFASLQEKVEEKLKLFSGSKFIIYCKDHKSVDEAIHRRQLPALSWGQSSASGIQVRRERSRYTLSFKGTSFSLSLPFTDNASVENCFHCVALMMHLGYKAPQIQERIANLQSVPMRLELKDGINQSQIIDDTYNNDLAGLKISLQFLSHQHQKTKKRLILSDILESGLDDSSLAKEVAALLSAHQIQTFVGVGKKLSSNRHLFDGDAIFFESTEDFLSDFDLDKISQEIVLVKGARVFQFEKIIERLQRKVHGTIMEIDLGGVTKNLNFFRGLLKPSTKIMVMVKAFAYGSGSAEIANLLQYHKVDYLGVAYADEGVDLRKNNITIPIMVMNPSEESFSQLLHYQLEPEMYSFRILKSFLGFLGKRNCSIHIKIDTGMHRLGFDETELDELVQILRDHPHVKVASVFSHLAGADEPEHDEFSEQQALAFEKSAKKIADALGYKPLYHILNSPGILRLPQFQMDMVRLGIGLYGIDPTADQRSQITPVATLKTTVSQIRKIRKGETVGYGRRGKADHDITIATIAIGYADGFSRAFSRGVGKVSINHRLAPVIGNVCMDMTMVDVTGLDVNEGDEAIIFGPDLSIHEVAATIHTIPYEILTNTSERVKRVFVAESI